MGFRLPKLVSQELVPSNYTLTARTVQVLVLALRAVRVTCSV